MELEQFEKDLEELDAELGEIDTPPAKYQIWVFNYDENDELLCESFLAEFDDPDPAVEQAKNFTQHKELLIKYATPETAYFGIEVETVVDLEGYEENVGTLFQEFIPLEK